MEQINALTLRDNAKHQLEQIKTIETGIDYLNKVKAIETWAKAEKKDAELQNMIAEQKIRTQRILGQLLKNSDLDKGGRPSENNRSHDRTGLSDFGITKNESSTFQKIAALPEEIFEAEIATAKAETEKRIELTTSRMVTAAKEYEHAKKKQDADLSDRDRELIACLDKGETIVVNQKTDLATIRHAEAKGLFMRADRFSDWGNPFEMDKDGTRDEVCDYFAEHYLPFKRSLLNQLHKLKGKALGCWCAPLRCHCDTLKSMCDGI